MIEEPDLQIHAEAEEYSIDTLEESGDTKIFRFRVSNNGDKTAKNCGARFELDGAHYPFYPEEKNAFEIQVDSRVCWAEKDKPTMVNINPGASFEFEFLQLTEGSEGDWFVAFASVEAWESIAPYQLSTENEAGNFTRDGQPIDELEDHTGYTRRNPMTGEVEHLNPRLNENYFKSQTDWEMKNLKITAENAGPIEKEIFFDWDDRLSLTIE